MTDYLKVETEIGPVSINFPGEYEVIAEAGLRTHSHPVEVFGVQYQTLIKFKYLEDGVFLDTSNPNSFYAIRTDHAKYKYRKYPSESAKNAIVKSLKTGIDNYFAAHPDILKKFKLNSIIFKRDALQQELEKVKERAQQIQDELNSLNSIQTTI